MDKDQYAGRWQLNEEKGYWYLENVVYCRKPEVPSLQSMNLYVPQAYRNSCGGWNWEGTCGKYTARTAPVIFENGVGGYAESGPKSILDPSRNSLELIRAGMVYVTPGSRGKQTRDQNGRLIGKSPVGLVDLKCAVRFLRHNRGQLAGDMEKIISVGMSAGGAMSSLLGVTGNSERYIPYLEAAGAFLEERDDVFAAQCYCPIIDLEHADMAYEWMFHGISEYEGRAGAGRGELDGFRMALSEKLAERYVDYFNSLKLRNPETGEILAFSEDGESGSAMEYLNGVLNRSAAKYLKLLSEKKLTVSCPAKARGEAPVYEDIPGTDKRSWLSWDGENASVKGLRAMEDTYLGRIKTCTSFDSLENTQAENQEFGDESHDFVHFDAVIGEILDELKEDFPEEYGEHRHKFEGLLEDEALQNRIYLLNPLRFIGTEEKTDPARHFRIRVGTRDPHTSFTMAMTLALKLMASGKSSVDYEMVWDAEHEKADYAGEFVKWVEELPGRQTESSKGSGSLAGRTKLWQGGR